MNNRNFILFGLLAAVLFMVGRAWYKRPNSVQGDLAIDFEIDAQTRLSSLRGNYVLLDFWGSWCGPCIEEAPKLVNLSRKMANQSFVDASGFCMVGFGIEDNKATFEQAAQRLGMVSDGTNGRWLQVSDFQKFDSPLAKQYGVRVIPTKFLIDPKGLIIAVNPSFEQLDKILNGKIAKK